MDVFLFIVSASTGARYHADKNAREDGYLDCTVVKIPASTNARSRQCNYRSRKQARKSMKSLMLL
jgi:hypothetical protein